LQGLTLLGSDLAKTSMQDLTPVEAFL
jgi:hypothetical protein